MVKHLEEFYKGRLHTHHSVAKIVDGDGIIVVNMFTNQSVEIRLLGLDAPESRRCKKLIQDEKETHLPATLLLELGQASYSFLKNLIPIGTKVSFYTETEEIDKYGRILAFVFTEDGTCINEALVKQGYAKAYTKYTCSQTSKYSKYQLEAKAAKRGHFSRVQHF
jgi:micrococcal nuclease